ncbi:MAG: tetratricopeptide repeat protein, partial [Treponema sp.]|nr:tetratricopeptide repeat protein [Treponema sp.]
SLLWGESYPAKYDDARLAYARLLETYGWSAPVVERMMKYFIRTDNLKETLSLRAWFDADAKRNLSAETTAELGGYLLDKRFADNKGVPDEYIDQIDKVYDVLLQAVYKDPSLPEAHYHLARYYKSLGNTADERITLENAIRLYENTQIETKLRRGYRIDSHLRYADVLINSREVMPAEDHLAKGVNLYEDAVERRLISPSPQYGKLYAGLGDIEYFVKSGNSDTALNFYQKAEQIGWNPPEMQYRMGAVYYYQEDWKNALLYFTASCEKLPSSQVNRRILFSLGNAALKHGNSFIAQGYYKRLIDLLDRQRVRLPVLLPNDNEEFLEVAQRLMYAYNNAGAACEMLAAQTGDRDYINQAINFYTQAENAWDSLTRNPDSMIRSTSQNLPFLNIRNIINPESNYEPQMELRIDRDFQETSVWEKIIGN